MAIRSPRGEHTPAGRALFSDEQWATISQSLRLSGRELEIVRCVFDDLKEARIAAQLEISTHTVHVHLERLYRKLSVHSRCSLVVRVLAECIDHYPLGPLRHSQRGSHLDGRRPNSRLDVRCDAPFGE